MTASLPPLLPTTSSQDGDAPPWRFRPRLTLQTLGRGDGLLGMQAHGDFGPRGGEVSIARVDWTYAGPGSAHWSMPAPVSVLHDRPPSLTQVLDSEGAVLVLKRDAEAEADAFDVLQATGLRPVADDSLQWRAPNLAQAAGQAHEPLWTLLQEDQFGDFWCEQVPRLRALGWAVVVRPGFVHRSTPVQAWHLLIQQGSGADAGDLSEQAVQALEPLRAPHRQGSWLVTLGVDIDGQMLDVAPMIADLVGRDKRWLRADELARLPDDALVILRAPGGRRIEARAAPLKAIVGALLDLLLDPRRRDGVPLRVQGWDAVRADTLRTQLAATMAQRAGPGGEWQMQGEAGLQALAQRLMAAGSPPSVPQPAGLAVTLRPYQCQGLAWLQYLRAHDLGGILADDMGLGKTAQALAHILTEKVAGRLDRPVLVVMPTSLVFNWLAEAARMAPTLRVLSLQGADRAASFDRIPQFDLVLTTYPLLWRDIDALSGQPFHTVILDEAQTVKNAGSKSAAAARRLSSLHRLCLTGTPLENHLGELWAQFDFLMPGFLGEQSAFQRLWRDPIERNGETLRAAVLATRVRPFILRRRKAEVLAELPPKAEVVQLLQLEGHQKALYESVRVAADTLVRRALARQGFKGAQIAVLDALLKLRQVCCDPWLLKGRRLPPGMERAKLHWLVDCLPALVAEGRRVLVFSQFTGMLTLIDAELGKMSLPRALLTGETPPGGRAEVVSRFQSGGVPLMLVSLKAGGVGLNLTAADTVIHVDPWWNPAVERQASDRAHRLGQTRAVTVYKLVMAGSIEERILALQERKAALADGLLGQDGPEGLKFDVDELQALLAPLL